ncbi:MAG: sialate O-acetylesterase [Bacteroidota bacterium]|nr:sialate O-acetylesterase [Bacteroidota bacterium]
MKRYYNLLIVTTLIICCLHLKANVNPASLFCDNAVLQRGVVVPVWGTADNNEKITLEFAGQKISTTAVNGNWMIKLKPLKAGGPFEMVITGNNKIILKNILVGEVWLCSGQSNMERQLGPRRGQKLIDNWREEVLDAVNYPNIREFALPHVTATQPQKEVNAKWIICDTTSVINFSAIGFFFGRELCKKYNVPIGLIHSSWGGTPAEKWTSRAALESNPELKALVDDYDKAIHDYPLKLEEYKKNESEILKKWSADTSLARQNNKTLPLKPTAPIDPMKSGDCGGLYNAMIAPLIPYAIKGVIWYQGESNSVRAKQYRTLFPAMINDWRNKWNNSRLPFLFVQIAPYRSNTPELREAQLLTWQKTPNTSMVVITDIGDSINIHPTHKRPVGERLALAARAIAYKEAIEYAGPVYKSMKISDGKIILSFTHVGTGLVAKDGALKGFIIAGSDKKFVPATAIISEDKVIVSAESIKEPLAVRYGWKNSPDINLFNKEDLPASPFRTDVEK